MQRKGFQIRIWQWGLLAAIFVFWWAMTKPGFIPAFFFSDDSQAAFFFGEPVIILQRIWEWFAGGEIYSHLGVTLYETVMAFVIGTIAGLAVGLWLALSPVAAAVADPFIKGFNSMPRVILAPIFAVWFGLGPASKIALGFTLVFFIVFFNVYQGVREVNPNVLASAKMLGATRRQLLRYVYLPSAMSWVFSSLHTSVGMAFVAAVIGEYLGSAEGVGYLILQAETTFDMNTVMAGILVLTACALILDRIVTEVEKRLMRWQPTVCWVSGHQPLNTAFFKFFLFGLSRISRSREPSFFVVLSTPRTWDGGRKNKSSTTRRSVDRLLTGI